MADSAVPPGADPATAKLYGQAAMSADVSNAVSSLQANIAARGRPGINASKSWDLPALIAGGTATVAVDVPGAAVGDFVIVSLTPAAPANMALQGDVTAKDVVTVGAVNRTAALISARLSSTLRVRVIPAS